MRFLFLLLPFIFETTLSQTHEVSGIITSITNGTKLAGASVFINNSSIGTSSYNDGKFILSGIPQNHFDLVISFVGYKTVIISITPQNINQFQNIIMEPRKEVLKNISVFLPDKDGWQKWGSLFKEAFLGRSDFASKCEIKNPNAIKFFNDKKNNSLVAYSDGNIIIINRALGYLLKCQLENFKYDFENHVITYTDYTVFSNLSARNQKKKLQWDEARKEAYRGSVMHFMRAVYADSIEENGFDVREKVRIKNTDTLFNIIYRNGNPPLIVFVGNDSFSVSVAKTKSENNIPEYIDLLSIKKFSFMDAVSYDSLQHVKKFLFNNYIQVLYKNAFAKKDFLLKNGFSTHTKNNQLSDAQIVSDDPLFIQKDGSYFDPTNFIVFGYWGWYAIAEMLPSDYSDK